MKINFASIDHKSNRRYSEEKQRKVDEKHADSF